MGGKIGLVTPKTKSSTTETIKEEGEVMVNGEIIEATLLSSFFYSVNYLLDE